MSPSTPGITLRDLAGTGFDYRVTWGEADVLLVRPGSAPAGHTTPTPRDLGLVDTAELITGASAAQLNAFLLPECLVLPLRKSTRNPFGELIVGRAATCDIVLLDRSVSKVHAYMREPRGPLHLWTVWEPKPSTNGTFVDGRRIAPMRYFGGGDSLEDPVRAETGEYARCGIGRVLRFGLVDSMLLDADGFQSALEYAEEAWRDMPPKPSSDTTRAGPHPFDTVIDLDAQDF
jgi:hypothetical protein